MTMGIDTMSSGKELDGLIAENVFGWKNLVWKEVSSKVDELGRWTSPTGWHGDGPNGATYLTKAYSTDMGDAWDVVSQLSQKYRISVHDMSVDGKWWQCSLEARDGKYRFPVELAHKGDEFANAETPALAICRAALKAVMGERNGY